MEYSYKPTTHGRAVMAACMALEKPFHMTRVAFGSGLVDKDANLADIHELVQYVSDGAVGERRHQDDRFEFTIQYANSKHKEIKTFLLTEFIVYAENPATGGETDLIYGTLGDYRQPVPAYNPAYPPSVFNFPLTMILSDEINVVISAPSGIVTHGELLKVLNDIRTQKTGIIIPTTGWVPDSDTKGVYALRCDIPNEDITAEMVPYLTVLPASLPAAVNCGLCPAARTTDGALRVYANKAPAVPINASLSMWTHFDAANQDRGELEIPVTGWEPDAEAGCLSLDIPWPSSREKLTPSLTILPESLRAAGDCVMRQLCQTLDGVIRVYADKPPAVPVKASLALMDLSTPPSGSGVTQTGGAAQLPAAANRLGPVKVGDGLNITPDGTLSLNTATRKEVTGLFGDSNS